MNQEPFVNATLVPDYRNEENYKEIISLCPPEECVLFKSFDIASKLAVQTEMSAAKMGVNIVRVKITAKLWKDWCSKYGKPLESAALSHYYIWLWKVARVDDDTKVKDWDNPRPE